MQSVIVYRNPLEAAMWENLMSLGSNPVFLGICLGTIVFIGVTGVCQSYQNTTFVNKKSAAIGGLCGLAACIALTWYLW